jgi:hypothetical protein
MWSEDAFAFGIIYLQYDMYIEPMRNLRLYNLGVSKSLDTVNIPIGKTNIPIEV